MAFLNFPKLAKEAELLLNITWKLGIATATPVFKSNGTAYARDAKFLVAVLNDALAPGGGADKLGLGWLSKSSLRRDLTAVKAAQATLNSGRQLSSSEIASCGRRRSG